MQKVSYDASTNKKHNRQTILQVKRKCTKGSIWWELQRTNAKQAYDVNDNQKVQKVKYNASDLTDQTIAPADE